MMSLISVKPPFNLRIDQFIVQLGYVTASRLRNPAATAIVLKLHATSNQTLYRGKHELISLGAHLIRTISSAYNEAGTAATTETAFVEFGELEPSVRQWSIVFGSAYSAFLRQIFVNPICCTQSTLFSVRSLL